MEKLKVQPAFTDDRGEIFDLVENRNINAITMITFRQGAIRGNHFHKQTTQWNYVMSGRIKLVSQVPGQDVVETILNEGEFAVTEPNVRHALVGLEESRLMVFTEGPRGGKDYETDTFRLEMPIAKQS